MDFASIKKYISCFLFCKCKFRSSLVHSDRGFKHKQTQKHAFLSFNWNISLYILSSWLTGFWVHLLIGLSQNALRKFTVATANSKFFADSEILIYVFWHIFFYRIVVSYCSGLSTKRCWQLRPVINSDPKTYIQSVPRKWLGSAVCVQRHSVHRVKNSWSEPFSRNGR